MEKIIRDILINFTEQLSYEPAIKNAKSGKKYSRYIVSGMGDSHLAADLLHRSRLADDLFVHVSYGLPNLPQDQLKKSLVVVISYSGNTEEALDSLEEAMNLNLDVAVITAGGKLLDIAVKKKLPYIKLPAFEPMFTNRETLGLTMRALLKMTGKEDLYNKLGQLAKTIKPKQLEKTGKEFAKRIAGYVPIIYTSHRNSGIAYAWKMELCETGKVPAFYNIFPELNHNEMNCFASHGKKDPLSKKFYFIFLYDEKDDARIRERMKITMKLYGRDLKTEMIKLKNGSNFEEMFNTILLGDWVAYYAALLHDADPEETKSIDTFKQMIA